MCDNRDIISEEIRAARSKGVNESYCTSTEAGLSAMPEASILFSAAEKATVAPPAAEKMDRKEAATIARTIAKAIIRLEFSGKAQDELGFSGCHVPTEKDLMAAEAAEQAFRSSPLVRLRASWRKAASITTPSNKRFAIPAVIMEAFVLIALIFVLYNYAHVAPEDPIQYTDKSTSDNITCSDGILIFNDVSANVPTDGNLKYSVSYSWAEDDTDYPSVPTSALVTYLDSQEGGTPIYEITLYRDSFTPKKSIPSGKDTINWFSGWSVEKSENLYAFPHSTGDINGFCISNLHAERVLKGYRTYTYYFVVQENGGISEYVLEGICYNSDKRDEFRNIMKKSIASIRHASKEA